MASRSGSRDHSGFSNNIVRTTRGRLQHQAGRLTLRPTPPPTRRPRHALRWRRHHRHRAAVRPAPSGKPRQPGHQDVEAITATTVTATTTCSRQSDHAPIRHARRVRHDGNGPALANRWQALRSSDGRLASASNYELDGGNVTFYYGDIHIYGQMLANAGLLLLGSDLTVDGGVIIATAARSRQTMAICTAAW